MDFKIKFVNFIRQRNGNPFLAFINSANYYFMNEIYCFAFLLQQKIKRNTLVFRHLTFGVFVFWLFADCCFTSLCI